MTFLANIRWRWIIAIALAWPLVVIGLAAVWLWEIVRAMRATQQGSGGLAAFGGSVFSVLFVLFAPPIVLLLLRAFAGRGSSR